MKTKITILALSLLTAVSWLITNQAIPTSFFKTQIVGDEIISLTNQYREHHSVDSLVVNEKLTEAAQKKAEHMAKNSYFAHTSPDGRKFTAWIKDVGYDYLYAGENLAVLFKDSETLFKAWLRSEKHRENITKGRFSEIGIGIAEGTYKGQKAYFVVQLFGEEKLSSL